MGVGELFDIYADAVRDGGAFVAHEDPQVSQFFPTPEVSTQTRAKVAGLAEEAKILLSNWLRNPVGDLGRLYYYGSKGELPEALFSWYDAGIASLPNKGESEGEFLACCLLGEMVAALAYGWELINKPEGLELIKLKETTLAARDLCAQYGLPRYTLTMIKRWLGAWREVEALRDGDEYWQEYTANSGYKALLLSGKAKTAKAKSLMEAWHIVAGGLFTAGELPDPVLVMGLLRTAISRGF